MPENRGGCNRAEQLTERNDFMVSKATLKSDLDAVEGFASKVGNRCWIGSVQGAVATWSGNTQMQRAAGADTALTNPDRIFRIKNRQILGVIKRHAHFGYIEMPKSMALKQAIHMGGYRYDLTDAISYVTIALQKRFDLASGKMIDEDPFA